MNANEVVRALHMMANEACVIGKCGTCPLGQYRANIDACDDFIMEQAAALIESLQAQLTKSQRRERAAVEDMKVMALAMRGSEELSEGCCFACIYDGQNLPDNVIIPYGECPGYETDDCFEWRGPQDEEGDTE